MIYPKPRVNRPHHALRLFIGRGGLYVRGILPSVAGLRDAAGLARHRPVRQQAVFDKAVVWNDDDAAPRGVRRTSFLVNARRKVCLLYPGSTSLPGEIIVNVCHAAAFSGHHILSSALRGDTESSLHHWKKRVESLWLKKSPPLLSLCLRSSCPPQREP